MNRRPLFKQLFFTFIPIVLIGIIALIILVNQFTRTFYFSQTTNDLRSRTQLISLTINDKSLKSNLIQEYVDQASLTGDMRITIVRKDGVVFGDSHKNHLQMDNHKNRPEILDAIQFGEGTSTRYSKTIQEEQIYFAFNPNNNQKVYIIRVSVSLNDFEDSMADLQSKILIIGVIISLFCLLISFYFSKQLTTPLEAMRLEAEKYVSTLKLSTPIPIPKTKELASLSISLNQIAMELDKRIKKMQLDKTEKESILSSMQEGLLALNKKTEILSINDIAVDYLNIKKEIAVGSEISTLSKNKKLLSIIKKVSKKNTRIQQEIVIKGNKKRHFLISGSPLKRGGKKSGVLMLINDITLQKQLESVRQDFVANVSHELKTPITSIIGYLELIDQGELKDEQKKLFLNKVFNHTNRMNAIIDDLLKLSKIESQEDDNSIELMPTPLSQIIDGSVDDLNTLTSKNNKKILVVCNESIMVNADPQLLREAIINLLENAVKYGTTGTDIKINVDQTETTNIQVINEGEVIPDKHRDRIFQRFYRIDKSRDREAGGTGLGLAIVKHISLVHGGEVGVSFSDNSETCFTISLPIL
tara:strand:+ start:123 stop:1880 length:1758 start_codon:yes stop_codon:yes gene_type:complete